MKNQKIKFLIRLGLAAILAMSLAVSMVGCNTAANEGATNEGTANEGTTNEGATNEGTVNEDVASAVELQIFAANSLEKALPEVQALYTAAHPEVTFAPSQFKGSGELVETLSGGAPADILITASKGSMDTANNNGLLDAATRFDMFANDLIVVKAKGSDIEFSSLEDVTSEAITSIAIGEADAVPAGQYANQALYSIGLYTDETGKGGEYDAAISTKIKPAASVGTAASYVSTGDSQIGFVYTSDLNRYEGIEQAFVIPSDAHSAILYPGAVLGSSENAEVAADFLNFCLTDPEAQQIWQQYGFEIL